MKNKIPDWIFIDGEKGEVFCKRCGEREKPKLPMPIDAFIKWSQYFGERHKFCGVQRAHDSPLLASRSRCVG